MATVLQRYGSGAYYSKLTMSFWIKRSKLGEQGIFGRREGSATANLSTCHFSGDDSLLINFRDGGGTSKYYMITSKFFRDVGAWYHIHIMLDGDNATQGDRSKLYVNGVRETSFQLLNNPSSTGYEVNLFVGGSYYTYIARGLRSQTDAWLTYEGCMSNFNCSTGYVYEPTVFGEVDTTTGQWKIINDPTFTPGTDGFTILKDGNTITDQSAGSNNFSLYSGTLTNTLDCPSNVFATLNPLVISELASLSKGNNTITGTSASNNSHSPATLQVGTSGKYYYEVKVTANESGGSEYSADGIVPNAEAIQQGTGAAGFFPKLYFDCQGKVERSSLGTGLADLTGLTSVGSTGIKMFAIDMDNGAIYIGANGVWLNNGSAVGVPTSGGSKTGAMWSFTPSDYPNIAICSSAYNGSVTNYNFGNGTFGTTAVSSAGTAGSTPGTFEYDVPSGYEPLSTKGLNA
jgi:hypothetical protein